MKKFLSVMLIASMLLCMIPAFGSFAADPVLYEAEDATIEGTASIQDGTDDTVSGGKFVGGIKANKVTFTVTVPAAGDYKVDIGHITANGRFMDIWVNDAEPRRIIGVNNDFIYGTNSWNGKVVVQAVDVTLVEGENTIAVGCKDGDSPNIDYIKVSPLADDPFATIDTPEEFAAFTKAVNAGTYVPLDVVKITADLDMKDIKDYEPINFMMCNFDFQGHTISNLVVTTAGAYSSNKVTEADAAIIANKSNWATVKNLKLYNCMLIANNVSRAALIVGDMAQGGLENITVENCTVKATFHPDLRADLGRYACALVAAFNYNSPTLSGIVVKNVLLDAPDALVYSALTGCTYRSIPTVASMTAENVTAKKGEEMVAVDKVLGTGDQIQYDPANVTITNTANATGYVAPATPDTPVTGDMTVYFALAGLIALAGVVVLKKKKIRN